MASRGLRLAEHHHLFVNIMRDSSSVRTKCEDQHVSVKYGRAVENHLRELATQPKVSGVDPCKLLGGGVQVAYAYQLYRANCDIEHDENAHLMIMIPTISYHSVNGLGALILCGNASREQVRSTAPSELELSTVEAWPQHQWHPCP